MENLYLKAIKKIRTYINENRNIEGESFLDNIIKRLDYMGYEDDEDLMELKYKLINELKKYTANLFKNNGNSYVRKRNLRRNIDEVKWLRSKFKINTSGRKCNLKQGELYFVELGKNIGSEQNGRRPVIILQNNKGNNYSNTTIIAPVTSHQSNEFGYDKEKEKYFIKNNERKKDLDFYEVPVRLKDEENIYGFVNIMQIRVVDRKRFCGGKLGIVSENCMREIIKAINENFKGYWQENLEKNEKKT